MIPPHLRPGPTAVSIGGLPHADPEEAARLVLGLHPDLPAAPQLPRSGEGILTQLLPWMTGLAPGPSGRLVLARGPVGPGLADPPPGKPPAGRWSGLAAFLAAIAARRVPAPPAVKVQLVGPLTLALGLRDAGLPPDAADALASAAVARAAMAVTAAVHAGSPSRVSVVFLDEPGLVRWAAEPPWPRPRATDALAAAVEQLGRLGCVTGVHCCGRPDWSVLAGAAPTVVSVPLDSVGPDDAPAARRHLERGGRIAWGVLPTDRPIPSSGADLGERLAGRAVERWRRLASAGGPDPELAADQALLSPDCGLSSVGVDDAGRALRLVSEAAAALADLTAPGAGR